MVVKEILVNNALLMPQAKTCSELLQIPIVSQSHSDFLLEFIGDGVIVHNKELNLRYCHSFLNTKFQQREQAQNQHLLKAFKTKNHTIHSILDVTAGWCRDSFILARNGYQLTAVEQSALLYCLNKTALELYQKEHTLNLNLQHANALDYLAETSQTFDAIYLDPMFPQHKNQAKNKKELQVLQSITQNTDMEAVFELALQKAKQRTVVKRPINASFLAHKKPDFQYLGKTIRFDVYQQFN